MRPRTVVSLFLVSMAACGSGGSDVGPDELAAAGGAFGSGGAMGTTGGEEGAGGTTATTSDSGAGGSKATGGTAAVDAGQGTGGTQPGDAATGAFVHPGILVNKGMLDYVKANVGSEPYKTALAKASASTYGSPAYTPHPRATVECGSYSNPDYGCTDEKNDADAAYTHALLFYYTGDKAHADKAIEIMNAWSSTVQQHTNSNAPLQSAWVAEVFPRAAEIIRYSSVGWSATDVAAFSAMLTTVYLPQVIAGSRSNGNWELSMIEAIMNIGVFNDDPPTFQKGVAMWRKRTPAYLYLTTDGATPVVPPTGNITGAALTTYWYGQTQLVDGVCQETCRDLGHVQYGLAAMVNAAETARIQGIDLFADEAKRITAGLEFHAQYLNGGAVPAWLCGGALTAVKAGPMWEIAYNAYAKVLGNALPSTLAVITANRPTGIDHHMAWETLTHGDIGTAGL
jgi:hypothetical protein